MKKFIIIISSLIVFALGFVSSMYLLNKRYTNRSDKSSTTTTSISEIKPVDENKETTTTTKNNKTTTTTAKATQKVTTTAKPTTTRVTTTIKRVTVVSTDNKSEVLSEETKYGVKIQKIKTYVLTTYSDGTTKVSNENVTEKKDFSTFKASTNELLAEATSLSQANNSRYQEMLGYVNKYRSDIGASPLELDPLLSKAATLRAIEIAWSNKFSHERPNGSSCFTVLNELGYRQGYRGENIAAGTTSTQYAADIWFNSEGHYKNMISTDYNKIGIGYIYLAGTTYGGYWVQMFSS